MDGVLAWQLQFVLEELLELAHSNLGLAAKVSLESELTQLELVR